MNKFEYRAFDKSGNLKRHTIAARSKEEAAAIVARKGLYLTDLKKKSRVDLNRELFAKVDSMDISVFCRYLKIMLSIGMPMERVLQILSEEVRSSRLKKTLKDSIKEISKGKSLSEALKASGSELPGLLIPIVESGEMSGRLEDVMERLAVHYEDQYKLNKKLKSSMYYPVALTLVCIAAMVFLLVFVMPNFSDVFSRAEAELPLVTRAMTGAGLFLREWWEALVSGLALAGLIVGRAVRTEKSKHAISRIQLNTPLISIPIKNILASEFARSMTILFSSGIPLVDCMEKASETLSNAYMKAEILESAERVKRGMSLYESIKDIEALPHMMKSMVKVGEETGQLEYVLEKVAAFYYEEFKDSMDKAIAMLEPILILIMSAVVLLMVLSVAIPMMDMLTVLESEL